MPTTTGSGLPPDSPRQRFAAAKVARLATVRPDGTPHVVPITFAVADEDVVTAIDSKPKRTNNLQRLRNLRTNPAVSLIVDHYDDDWNRLWWVRVDGLGRIAEDGPERARALKALVEKYSQYSADPPAGPAIIIEPAGWTAWSAHSAP
ncbi:TIGR03668 family PPOX class F420-dependent oxidoreductase [Hoyosella subflava]|uniref:PPOX class putative F420-dependent enzyme n=1 Tax=Hoyosella subflava (strain DSM 45089 / JCM 17490 / NBRC 109087 / DQS3-9A1) TaxID=443218 RepID=F6ER64_HOYSD|nr:TIGR03668 family PPOX class F420-dependent oxidoreductase [Hoyosella subflava]AEF40751.1 PPOX class putative F420-dependent enzyme [Hoyosella subflava DQS3-9A1]